MQLTSRWETPRRAVLSSEGGVPGDAWLRDSPEKLDAQVSLLRVDVARLLANRQPLSLFGDNLLVDLDLSMNNLPAGSRLRVGAALLRGLDRGDPASLTSVRGYS